ncbi:MAG: sugar ABC transporter permease [Oscillochloris sp.]|nr:sugar ABC transporter permease [Oscillochloris sp.]
MLAPFLLGVALLVVIPAGLSLGLAFTSYDGLTAPTWNELANFRFLAQDTLFRTAVINSLLFVVLTVPLRTLITLGLALLLARPRRGIGFYRAAVYLPTVVPSVAYALIWLWILNPSYGPLNLLLDSAALPTPAWLVDPRTALPAIALTALFQLGEGFVVLIAGLQEIPDSYYEMAALDGAGRWVVLQQIILPLLAPWLMLIIIRDLIVSVQSSFTPALLMTGGGPYYATLFLPLLIYQTAFDRFRFGEGAAMTLFVFVGVGLMILLTNRLFGGWGYDESV